MMKPFTALTAVHVDQVLSNARSGHVIRSFAVIFAGHEVHDHWADHNWNVGRSRMTMLDGKLKTVGRAMALAVMFGLALTGPVSAQVSTPTEGVEAPTEIATTATSTVDEEEDEGFDDWGLLGLLGLAGLAGLRARQSRVVEPARTERVEPVRTERVDTTRVDTTIDGDVDPRR